MSVPVHGNYYGYYLKRPSVTDPRLGLLPKDLFAAKSVLDIGCNEGWVTCEIAQAWGAHTVVGVDIDDTLIRAAWKRRQLVWSLQEPDIPRTDDEMDDEKEDGVPQLVAKRPPQSNYFPASLEHSFGPLPVPPSQIRGKYMFPHNVSFRTADWTGEAATAEEAASYDVVVAFSISKWIHLNSGDDGLRDFFQRVHFVLKPGGVFILEPQEWETYRKAKRLDESLKTTAQQLKIRPDDFESILQGIGFGSAQRLGTTGEGGFCRRVDLYEKQR